MRAFRRFGPPVASVKDGDAAANGGSVADAAAKQHSTLSNASASATTAKQHSTLSNASASATTRADAPSPARFIETDVADEYDFE